MRESLRRLLASSEECGRGAGAGVVARAGAVAGAGAGSMRRVRVELLDGEHINVDVPRQAKGADLLQLVCQALELVEEDYFGLLHQQRGDPRVWVDLNRRLSKTFRNEPWDVRLAVKFYPPEPSELHDDATRYQLCLAVRRDLLEGRLSCSSITYALLASYVLQAELGDRAEPPGNRLQQLRAAPLHALTEDLEERADELYGKHKGQSPAQAELNYLESAKRLPLYGAELHCARAADGGDILLAVGAQGIAVYRDGVVMNRFPWAKISKISYSKRQFALRLRPAEFDAFETQLLFQLPATRACKKLWRCSVEHHIFFRREAPVAVRVVRGFPALGARRLSCRRTLRQMRDPAFATAAA